MKMQKTRAVIGDWDDTKTETFAGVSALYVQFAMEHGLLVPTKADVQNQWGNPIPLLFAGLWGKESTEKIIEQFWKYVQSIDYSVKPFPFTRDTILKLQNMDLIQSVISSGPRKEMLKTLDRHIQLPEKTFLMIQGADEAPVHKPDPAVFDQTFAKLNEMGTKEAETLYIGDGLSDLKASRARRVHFVAVLTGLVTREQFIAAGVKPEDILENYGLLPEYLSKYS